MSIIRLCGFMVLSAFSVYGCGDPLVAECEKQADSSDMGQVVLAMGRDKYIKSCVETAKELQGL